MKPKPATTNIPISKETHQLLIAHAQKIDAIIWKWADRAIRERIQIEQEKTKQAF